MDRVYWGQADIKINSNSNKEKPTIVETVNNHIYFYGPVMPENVLILTKALKTLDAKNVAEYMNNGLSEIPPIYLHINSGGGYLDDGMAAADVIRTCKSKVITIVEGACASAGTLMSVVGQERWIQKHAFMLIHQLSSGFWGKYYEFKDEIENLNLWMENIRNVYREHTKIPHEQLDELLKHDLFFDAKKCLEYGLVDKILD